MAAYMTCQVWLIKQLIWKTYKKVLSLIFSQETEASSMIASVKLNYVRPTDDDQSESTGEVTPFGRLIVDSWMSM